MHDTGADTIMLSPHGSFRAVSSSRAGTVPDVWHLVPNAGADRWTLAGPSRLPTLAPVVSMHVSLDDGLAALATAAGYGDPFDVRVSGAKFTRPGAVRAEEVVRTLGHEIVRSVFGYLLVHTVRNASAGDVESWVADKIEGSSLALEECSFSDVKDGSSYWICVLRLGFEGVIARDVATAAIQGVCASHGLEATDEVDFDHWGEARVNRACVIPLTRAAA